MTGFSVDMVLGGTIGGMVAVFAALVAYMLASKKLRLAERRIIAKADIDATQLCRAVLEEQHLRDSMEIEGLSHRLEKLELSLEENINTRRRQASEISRLQTELQQAEDRIAGLEKRLIEIHGEYERLKNSEALCKCGRRAS